MQKQKIVITGGPGTGKSSIIAHLKDLGWICYDEISREVTREARKSGFDQLFLSHPLMFSEMLLKARQEQYQESDTHKSQTIFFDRALPDVLAYMHYIGHKTPSYFKSICQDNRYDQVFILKPWKTIYVKDTERYESFDQALSIHNEIVSTYESHHYTLIDVPFDTVEKRTRFILKALGH